MIIQSRTVKLLPLSFTRRNFFSTSTSNLKIISTKPHRTHLPTSNLTPTTHTFYHKESSTFTYLVFDQTSNKKNTILIDSALDFDVEGCEISTGTADSLLGFIKDEGLFVEKILETHAHADHLTASRYFKRAFKREEGRDVPICIGKRIKEVQDYWQEKLSISKVEMENSFDKLWEDDEEFMLGNMRVKVRHLPGHTPDHVGYQVGDIIFCGDSIFLPDVGSARADFPGGSTNSLYTSSQKLLSLPPQTRIFSGHDYPGNGKERLIPSCSSTVEEQLLNNLHLKRGTVQDEFIEMREKRDKGLLEPRLLFQSLQINLRAGKMPRDGLLRIPLKVPVGFSD